MEKGRFQYANTAGRCGWLAVLVFVVMGVMVPRVARANLAVAQVIGMAEAVTDEFGEPLVGTDPSAELFGVSVDEGDVVQVLLATDGAIYPPDLNGNPDPRNEILLTTRIGRGTSPNQARPARFGGSLSPRPGGGSRIFVRVFNARSLEDANFYGDSQVFTVQSWANEVFMAEVAATDKALDTRDFDGDGLNNSWEQSYGSDPNAVDTDGDGYADASEALAGTDLLDAESVFVVSNIRTSEDGKVVLTWDAAEGVTYRVEHLSGPLADASVLESVSVTGNQCELSVKEGTNAQLGFFRVCAVQ